MRIPPKTRFDAGLRRERDITRNCKVNKYAIELAAESWNILRLNKNQMQASPDHQVTPRSAAGCPAPFLDLILSLSSYYRHYHSPKHSPFPSFPALSTQRSFYCFGKESNRMISLLRSCVTCISSSKNKLTVSLKLLLVWHRYTQTGVVDLGNSGVQQDIRWISNTADFKVELEERSCKYIKWK
jgi:hypothetical protein